MIYHADLIDANVRRVKRLVAVLAVIAVSDLFVFAGVAERNSVG